MTRSELHSLQGFHPASLIATATHLRDTMIRNKVPSEPTALIRNEGYINGYLDALQAVENAAFEVKPKPEKRDFQPYSQPASENLNRP